MKIKIENSQGRNKKCRILVFAFVLLLRINSSSAQASFGYLFGSGIMFYSGDLNEKTDKLISPTKVFKPFIRIGANYRFEKRMEISATYFYGNIAGADSLAIEVDNRLRNQNFKSHISEFAIAVEYHLFSVFKRRLVNPFVTAGVGFFIFNPKGEINGVWYDLQPLGTEGQNVKNGKYSYPKPYSLTQFTYPLGIGTYFLVSDHWRIRLEYATHFTLTDYLDDTSNIYPDSTDLLKTPNGQLAWQFSNRRKSGWFAGRLRGHSNHYDNYTSLGMTVIYNPGVLIIQKKKMPKEVF